jgi:hypothetical protein
MARLDRTTRSTPGLTGSHRNVSGAAKTNSATDDIELALANGATITFAQFIFNGEVLGIGVCAQHGDGLRCADHPALGGFDEQPQVIAAPAFGTLRCSKIESVL